MQSAAKDINYWRINYNRGLWKLSEYDAINSVSYGEFEFFVLEDGQAQRVIITQLGGRQYLKMEAKGYSPDNLPVLSECP